MFYTPIKPCEYCGGKARVIVQVITRPKVNNYSKYVECGSCGARSGTYKGQWTDEETWSKAEDMWNAMIIPKE